MAKRTDKRRSQRGRQPAGRDSPGPATARSGSDSEDTSPLFEWPAVSRAELLALVAILLLAGGLRLFNLSRVAVEHFDEGVYASSLWFSPEEGNEYPDRHLYAPPLFPWLVEQASLFGVILADGPQTGAILVNIAGGVLTVAAVWWVGRSWFSPMAGLAAALLAATSGFHLLYSRTVLTDTTLGLWLVCAVSVLPAAVAGGRRSQIVLGGVLTGLAWWTKYNGWLPLAISSAGLIAWQTERVLLARHGSGVSAGLKQAVREWLRWLAVAGVAALVWSPVWWSLQERGGYTAVAANHRQYLVGISGWWDGLCRQAAAQQFLSGWTDCLGLGLALLLCGWFLNRPTTGEPTVSNPSLRTDIPAAACWLPLATTGAGLAVLAGWGGSAVILTGLATVWFTRQLWAPWSMAGHQTVFAAEPQEGSATSRMSIRPAENNVSPLPRLRMWMLLAWFVGLLLVTPLYRPYPRLTLPWLISSWLAAGAAVVSLAARLRISLMRRTSTGQPTAVSEQDAPPAPSALPCRKARGRSPLIAWSCGLAGLLVVLCAQLQLQPESPLARSMSAWQPRTGFQQISGELLTAASGEILHSGSPTSGPVCMAVYVIGEPGLFYQLSRRGDEVAALIHPLGNLQFAAPDQQPLPIPLFAVLGPHALRDPGVRSQLDQFAPRLQQVGEFSYQPSDLVELNSPAAVRNPSGQQHPSKVLLFRVLDQSRSVTRPAG